MTRSELIREALRLPPKARAALAAELIESLDAGSADEDAESAWTKEIRRRVGEIESGAVKTIPWTEVRRRIMTAAGAPKR
jgi:putative addiction module component (TIGR02574 family)